MLRPGDVLQSRYEIEAQIGEGGMGRVYRARQSLLGRRLVAVKEIHIEGLTPAEHAASVIEFMREGELLALLCHPNLVGVIDCFEEDDRLFLVMEYVPGRSAEQFLKDYPDGLPPGMVLDWLRQLCTALTYLHTFDPPVIFRDLKPSNVMVDSHGVIRLVDFGIACLSVQEHWEPQGTLGFAPLEQMVDRAARPDPRQDIHALGATTYHLLTGKRPIDPRQRLLYDPLPPPAHLRPSLPTWLSQGVLRMMAVRAEDRFQSAQEVRDWVDRLDQRPRTVPAEQPGLAGDEGPALQVWWTSASGRRSAVRMHTVIHKNVNFETEAVHALDMPRYLYFSRPAAGEVVRVRFRLLRCRVQGSRMTCDAQLLSPPARLIEILEEVVRPDALGVHRFCRAHPRMHVELDATVLDAALGVHTLDLSLGGARVISPQPLAVGQSLTLCLALRHPVLPDLEMLAEARWCRATWGGTYESGLQWLCVDPRSQDILRMYLQEAAHAVHTGPLHASGM